MSMILVAEASKLVARSIPTIYRHIKQGKLSAHVDNDGNKVIDVSELQRFYNSVDTVENHDNDDVSQRESNYSQARIADLDRHIRHLSETVDDLRTRLTKAEERGDHALRLLTDQRSVDDQPKKQRKKGKKRKGKKRKK